jgi:hypothetical protein
MTRLTIPRFLRRTLTAGIGLAALAVPLALMGTSSASAAPLNLRPESFSIFISTFDQAGSVSAFGPVHGFGTITTPAPNLAVLDLNYPHGTVYVKHTPEPAPVINWRECTETTYQNGQWQFVGGTGRDWGAFGFGHFQLEQFSVLKRGHHGACELNAQPRYFQVSVQAEGLAAR